MNINLGYIRPTPKEQDIIKFKEYVNNIHGGYMHLTPENPWITRDVSTAHEDWLNSLVLKGILGVYEIPNKIHNFRLCSYYYMKNDPRWIPVPILCKINIVKKEIDAIDLNRMGIQTTPFNTSQNTQQLESIIQFIVGFLAKTKDKKIIKKTLHIASTRGFFFSIPFALILELGLNFTDTPNIKLTKLYIKHRDFLCPLCDHQFKIINPQSIILTCPACHGRFNGGQEN